MPDRGKVIRGLEMHASGLCNVLTTNGKEYCPYWENNDNCMVQLLKDALSLLKAQEPGWISVNDRLPEDDVDVIAWEKAGFAFIDSIKRGMWKVGENNFAVVTHWMPLPTPPEVNHDDD